MNEFFDASTNNHRKREIGKYFVHSVITYEWDWTINFNFEKFVLLFSHEVLYFCSSFCLNQVYIFYLHNTMISTSSMT